MTRHVVIGTAGHVDHGKTALVKQLTGVDTDRWEEEKRRGITMDLGFAPLALGDGLTASIVDVPGHEDFVRNMVAGATGIDVALLVVAADEGVMPQTVEHLAILEFLSLPTGVVAITKADLAEPDWLSLVQEDLGERLGSSGIAWEPPVVCSAVTGQGADDVLAALTRAAARARVRAADDLFRLPVDRVFSVAGAGTVVTGTTWSGSVAAGESVRALPGDGRSRIRSIQVHDEPRERAEPGRRTALALPDLSKDAVGRGTVVVADEAWDVTHRLDAVLTLLPQSRALTQRSRVRVHLGTAEVLARVTPAEGDIPAGGTGAVRLRLEGPLVARWGDRGVLRSYSPVTTIGGLVVIDPAPAPRPRRPRDVAGRGAAGPAERLGAFVGASPRNGLPVGLLSVRLGLHPNDVPGLLEGLGGLGLRQVGETIVREDVLEDVRRETLVALERFHTANPLEPGMPLEELRRAVDPEDLADYVQHELAAAGKMVLQGSVARLPQHAAEVPKADEAAAQQLEADLRTAGRQGLATQDVIQRLAEHFVRNGTARKVRDRYYLSEALDELIRATLAAIDETGSATPAELRDRLGLTRKTLIPLLEWLDEQGFTIRKGDVRQLGRGG